MKTYQDLLDVGLSETDRMAFVRQVISEHKGTPMYRIAADAEEYDKQNNVTIMAYEKVLYTISGRATVDTYSPNHKIASNFFNRFVTQENQYLLGNGIQMDAENKEKLGRDIDHQVQMMGRNALVQGVSFGFWNLDHLEVFKLTEFVPLYDEETGALMAGIRYYQIDASKPLRATLYEIDGYTDYLQDESGQMNLLNPKRPYIQVTVQSEADGTEVVDGMNYPGFPIIPMWGNLHRQSELVGLRQSIDAYDLIKSGFANDMDGAQLYWMLKNSGGMDDVDLAKFMERLNILKIASVEDETDITPKEVPIPYESRVAYLERLEQDMYKDFQALNVADISGTQKTATEITAAYQPFDNKVDQYEYCVLQFLNALFDIVGIEDTPSFTRDKVATTSDDMQTLLMGAEYLDDEYLTRKVCAILGDPDAADEILARKTDMDYSRLLAAPEQEPAEPVTDDAE